MSYTLRSAIYKKIAKYLTNTDDAIKFNIISHVSLENNNNNGTYSFVLPLKTRQYNILNEGNNIINSETDTMINSIQINDSVLTFNVSKEIYIKQILENNCNGISAPKFSDGSKNIIVEYSSPNIAKPFHFGHLRSTIIGNSIANIHSFLQNNVKRINYLGDWGTQYGLVHLGIDITKSTDEEIKQNPLRALYNAYIVANKQMEEDPSLYNEAKRIFQSLENGDSNIYKKWDVLRKYTVNELRKTYTRINVTFDEYHWESMYNAHNIKELIKELEEMKLLKTDEQNRKVITVHTRNVPLLKNDGSTLYITRDIAAAMDRFEKNNFDNMYYVVENGQAAHFTNLTNILEKMGISWTDRIKHVKFGRIHGMSTRKGTAIFLEDILDEARNMMRERQIQSPTTKVPLDLDDNSADVLGVSAVVINDLKQKRQRDYAFDWNSALDVKGNTGVKLQYCHCRLTNIIESSGGTLVHECDPALLKESEVDDLVTLLGKFDEAVLRSYIDLEPSILVIYLLNLSRSINKAIKRLRVKNEASDVANQRYLLFYVSRNVLSQGMRLVGLTPLHKM